MKLFKKEITPLLDLTRPMPEDRSLKRRFYRKASLAKQTDWQIIQNWKRISSLLDSWFTMEELQDNQRLLMNVRIMMLISKFQIPVFKEKEDKVWYLSGDLWISLSPQLKDVLSHDEWDMFFRYLLRRLLLDDETKKLKDMMITIINMTTKLGLPIKYLEQKIMLAGIHHAIGLYLIEREFDTKMEDAMKIAGDGFWEAAMYRTASVFER